MARKRRRKVRRDESLHRNVIISSIAPSVSFSMKDANDPDPLLHGRPWLELRAYMPEPVRDVHEIVLKLWADSEWRVGTVRPASVAHITGIKPDVEVLCSLPPTEFSYIWSLALSGHLTHASISFTKPHYGSASVTYVSFSNEVEE